LHDQVRLELDAVLDVTVWVIDLCGSGVRVRQDAQSEQTGGGKAT
jgi:hypothetical protein